MEEGHSMCCFGPQATRTMSVYISVVLNPQVWVGFSVALWEPDAVGAEPGVRAYSEELVPWRLLSRRGL